MTARKPIPGIGIFPGIPAAEYHAMDGVSNSQLKVFSGDSPAHYRAMLDGAPEDDSELSDDERKSRVLGTLVHLAILEPELFRAGDSHHVKPKTYTDEKGKVKPWSGNATACKEWLATHEDIPVISSKEEARIIGARNAVMDHPVAGPLLSGKGTNEASVFAVHPASGLTLRIRSDRLTEDADGRPWVIDLKSCPDVRRFKFTAADYSYDKQATYYSDVLALAGVANVAFAFVAFELAPRYGIHAVRVVMPDFDTTMRARELYETDLARLSVCQETGNWPLGCEEIELITVKRWI